jgi:hypothetical protein
MKCPVGHTWDIEDPATFSHIDIKDENGEEERLYICGVCKVVFIVDEDSFR